MYPSYNGWSSRSKSTTDVYRASTRVSELEDDSSYPLASYSILSRLDSRRRHETIASSTNISCVRSYLTDDVRKQFEDGFETSTSNKNNDVGDTLPSSACSNNFVKRLVVTLERQQSQQQQQRSFIGGSKIANDEFYKRDGVMHVERLGHEQPTLPIRIHAPDLEDLYEHENECISSDDDYSYHAFYDQRKTTTTQENDSNTTFKPSKPTKITRVRCTLKSVISTIKRWRLGPKSLSKGSRDYYATRESLGEEMRAFHRDTLPRLMEHAQVKSLGVAEQRDKKLQTPREFTKSIVSPSMMGMRRQPITATIHSPYGGHSRLPRYREGTRVQSERVMDEAGEVPHGSKKVEPPSVPSSPRAAEPEPLLRQSEVHDIKKRYSSDSGKVQLRRWLPPQHAASVTTLDVVYDVPRPITPVTEDVIIQHLLRLSPSHGYANISGGDVNEDKRLNCTAFTTF